MEQNRQVIWAFHRLGGMDQVTLETSDEICRLRELDPKLWATLSCPATGLEFDSRTLMLLDSDGDGRIRIPEVIEAVEWTCRRLNDPSELAERAEELPLASIREDTEEGKRLLATADLVLQSGGRGGQGCINEEDVSGAAAVANALLFNGDGIFPPHPDLDPDKIRFITSALSIIGGEQDAGGENGINASGVDVFMTTLKAEHDWRRSLEYAPHPLGADTAKAWSLFTTVKDKVEDYFLRCHLAAFAPQSSASLNAEEQLVAPDAYGLLDLQALAGLPLSRVAPEALLKLDSGLNPAWREKVQTFFKLVAPVLGQSSALSEEDWNGLCFLMEPYGSAVAARPAIVSEASIKADKPEDALSALSDEQIRTMLESDAAESLKDMMARDLSSPSLATDVTELEKMVLYYRHLHRFLMNFVSFHDFYSLKRQAMFQAGMLFMDGRSCRLCLPVGDVGRHSTMASLSMLCLVYCTCRRRGAEPEAAVDMNMVAAMTAGSDAFLREGRNGVYVDNEGYDWDATIVKIVRNPISIRQAVWSPYLRMSRMAADQIARFASSGDAKFLSAAAQKIGVAASPAKSASFDISKSVGLFAAVGIALGAIGTAVGSIAGALMALHWWQFPLLLLVAFICISGPAAFLAWLKLRKRTLGPVLEASGWAVNGQLPVSLLLGSALTSEAELPDNSTRTRHDPLLHAGKRGKIILTVVVVALLGLGYLGWTGELAKFVKKVITVEQSEQPLNTTAAPGTRKDPPSGGK